MTYGSVCSGIECATVAWHPLGWQPAWFSEIEPFPCRLLQHYYPHVPNLGDMLKIEHNEHFQRSTIDLLVGGTPCQSFSTAGLRGGLADDRGNLALEFCRILTIKQPRWFVWENVPGVLSSNEGKDFRSIMDAFEECGYICDVDILDAQFFGVPQRRKRVFVCGQSREDLINQKTSTSALTISQCLVEILHSILIEVSNRSGKELQNSEQAGLSKDGRFRRMKLFGIATENCNYNKLQENLIDALLKCQPEVRRWDLGDGRKALPDSTPEDLLMGSPTDLQFILTEESLKKSLAEILPVMKLSITSTSISSITPQEIFTFLSAGLTIARLICRLSGWSPSSWQSVLSSLTFIQDITNYARQTNASLFEQLAGVQSWGDIIRETKHAIEFVGYLGDDWRPSAAVLLEPEGLRRNPPKSGKKRTAVAGTLRSGPALRRVDEKSAFSNHLVSGTLEASCGRLQGASGQDGGHGHSTLICWSVMPMNSSKDYKAREVEVMQPITTNQVISNNGGDIVQQNYSVRRFTPLECERLQGFPDNYTLIPGAADSPRYESIGNSMAMPVMRWIGKRIDMVDKIFKSLS